MPKITVTSETEIRLLRAYVAELEWKLDQIISGDIGPEIDHMDGQRFVVSRRA